MDGLTGAIGRGARKSSDQFDQIGLAVASGFVEEPPEMSLDRTFGHAQRLCRLGHPANWTMARRIRSSLGVSL
jgi:hypothetical protein